MANKLLRTVRRLSTARKIAKRKIVTIFLKTTNGYFETGERKGQIAKHIIRGRDYEIYDGEFYNYQNTLRENQRVERIDSTI